MKNSDQRKCGSLSKGFKTQCSLGNDQCPTTMTDGADVLTDHQWDQAHSKSLKKKRAQRQEGRDKDKKNQQEQSEQQEQQNDKTGTSFGQQGRDTKDATCCCCGKKGHLSTDCPDKDKTAKEDWAIKKGTQTHNEDDTNEGDTDDEAASTTAKKERSKKKISWMGLQLTEKIDQDEQTGRSCHL